MTQIELLKFVQLKLPDLYNLVRGRSYNDVMLLKKELQKAMTVYSKNKNGTFDPVQEKSLAMMMKLEKWMKQIFIEKQLRYLRRTCPQLTESGRKAAARSSWEVYNASMNY